MRVDLAPGATTRARLLFVASVAALLVAVAYGSVALVVFAVAASMPLLRATPKRNGRLLLAECAGPLGTLVEGEPFDVTVTLTVDAQCEALRAIVRPNDWAKVTHDTALRIDTTSLSWDVGLIATRWGPIVTPTVCVCAISTRGLHQVQAEFRLPIDLVALPRPAPMRPLAATLARRGRVGNHPSTTPGAGVEFHGIRPYHPGDLPRRIHWPASTRRGQLHVTDRVAESAIDTVVVIDAFTESGPAGDSTLDHSVRGAAGVAKAMLESGDRVGLAMLGGLLGWIAPATSKRQWYRIATTALGVSVHESFVTPDIARIPRVAMPAGALVVVFSPLLDDRVISVLGDLRRRRFGVVVVDVLPSPSPSPAARADTPQALADRLWRAGRASTHARLATIGCTVLRWNGRAPITVPDRRRSTG